MSKKLMQSATAQITKRTTPIIPKLFFLSKEASIQLEINDRIKTADFLYRSGISLTNKRKCRNFLIKEQFIPSMVDEHLEQAMLIAKRWREELA